MPDLALYQPDIPQNTGTLLRLGACLGIAVHIIGPAGFDMSDRNLRRAGMDYLDMATLHRHTGWSAFAQFVQQEKRRLVLATTKSRSCYEAFAFQVDDIVMLGRESAGVPQDVAQACDARITIPMRPGARSLNIAVAGAMVIGEALRQTGTFPRSGDASPA